MGRLSLLIVFVAMFLAAPLQASPLETFHQEDGLLIISDDNSPLDFAPSLSSIYPNVEDGSDSHNTIQSDSSSPFVFSFPSHRWNLIVDSDGGKKLKQPLAGWQSVDTLNPADSVNAAFNNPSVLTSADDFKMADTFNNYYFYGQSSTQFEKDSKSASSEKLEESSTARDGKSQYHYRNLKNDKSELFVANARHDVADGRTLDARVLVSSENNGNSDFFVTDIASPSRTTQLGIGANVGKIRVWGEFQMNDWNGLGGSVRVPQGVSGGRSNPDVSVSALSSSNTEGSVSSSSPFDNNLVSGRTAFEVGASFPASKVRGAVRYRKSFDEVDTSRGFSRQHLGIEGEVKLEDDVYFKAGYERVNSISSASEQNESSLWTGIEVNF